MWSGILLLGILGYLLNLVFMIIERRVLALAPRRAGEHARLTGHGAARDRGPGQDLRRGRRRDARDRRRLLRARRARVRVRRRPVRLRQDDAAEVHVGAARADARRGAAARRARRRARRSRWRSCSRSTARSLLPWLSVRGNVVLPLRHKKLEKAERARLVEEAVDAVGLTTLHRPLPVGAVGRHAAARGDRAGARLPARDPADGRAVRVGRRPDPRRPRGPDPARCATATR